MWTTGNGKIKVEKVGLKEITREGFEYELTVNLELDIKHNAKSSKDRTGLFMDQPEFVPSEATGRMILDWCNSGSEPIDNRPLMTDDAMIKILDRIKAGEIELYEKSRAHFNVRPDQDEMLLDATMYASESKEVQP